MFMNGWLNPWRQSPAKRTPILRQFLIGLALCSKLISASFAEIPQPLQQAETNKVTDSESLTFLQQIEFEIQLLRAEIAHRNGDHVQFIQHMHQLSRFLQIPPRFEARYQRLQQLWSQLIPNRSQNTPDFSKASQAQEIVILLPLSGTYAPAGHHLLEALQAGLPDKKVFVIDTDLYDNMIELWSLVKLFNPDLIIGPLERDKAQSFLEEGMPIPTLLLTSIEKDYPHVRSLADIASSYTEALFPWLTYQTIDSIVWLSDTSHQAKEILEKVEVQLATHKTEPASQQEPAQLEQGSQDQETESLSNPNSPNAQPIIQPILINGGLDQTLARTLGVEQSAARHLWLQRTLGRSLEFNPRVRKDKTHLIALLPIGQAQQLKPLLDYHQLNLPILWIPTQLPAAELFSNRLTSWQQTQALLPYHLLYPYQTMKKNPNQSAEEVQVGLLHALANLATTLLQESHQPLPYETETEIGKVRVNADGHYYVLPTLVEIGQGKLSVKEFEMPDLSLQPQTAVSE